MSASVVTSAASVVSSASSVGSGSGPGLSSGSRQAPVTSSHLNVVLQRTWLILHSAPDPHSVSKKEDVVDV